MPSKSYEAIEELIPGQLWVIRHKHKRSTFWYARVYTGDRKYSERSLKTEDLKTAKEKAYEIYVEVKNQIKVTGSASPKTIRFYVDKWIKRQSDRNAGDTLSTSLFRAHRNTFENFVINYSEYKGWKLIKDIPHDGWVEYRKWRMEEGWKMIGLDEKGNIRPGTNRLRKAPKHSTVNREVTMIQEWCKYMLVPEGLVQVPWVIQKAKGQKGEKDANAPFTPSDYTKIQRRFRAWSNEKDLTRAQKPEWRKVVYLFFLISTNVGWRPDSEGLEFTWDRIKMRKRRTTLPNGEEKIEHVVNLRIWDRKNKREREGNFLGGEYFQRLKDLYLQWHKENPSFHLPNSKSLVFADPLTGKKLSYTSVYNSYKDVLESLGMKEKYTFYSCRSFHVNERLKEGVEIYTVAKQTGHSMAICNHYYAKLDISSRADEATKRTYGKKKVDEGESLF